MIYIISNYMKQLYKILFLFVILFASNLSVKSQTINLVRFNNTADYTAGSGVSVIINPTGIFQLNNQFILELSTIGGAFTTPTTLNTLNEFYVPVVNGTLPATLAPGSYKLRVRSTLPVVIMETLAFNVVGGSSIVPSAISALVPNSNFFNCIDCSSPQTIFGTLNRSDVATVGATSGGIPTLNRNITICNYDPASIYNIKLIDILGGTSININHVNGTFTIPASLGIGTYVFEIEKVQNSTSSIFSVIFLFHGSGTSLGNSTSEFVCVGDNVTFNVLTSLAGIGRNYYGSKYTIDFGDGSSILELTHAELITSPIISHVFTNVSCDKPGSAFIVQKKLLNKGIYVSGGNTNYCNTYYNNGGGVIKNVNTSIAPIASFDLIQKQCIGNAINATNTTTPGSYGTNGCLDDVTYSWSYRKPGQSTFTLVTIASWIDSSFNLTIPSTFVNIPGCWDIKLETLNPDLCQTVTEANHTINIEAVPNPSFTNAPQSPICSGTSIQFTNTSNVLNLPCQEPTYSWTVTPVTGTPASASGYQFVNPSTSSSQNPLILFTQPGSYSVTLSISNSCSPGTFTSSPQIIEVFGDPTVSFNPNTLTICNQAPPNHTIDFSQVGTTPTYSGTPYAPTNFLWTVSGSGVISADYSFIGGTTASSQYPKIKFTTFKTYIISVQVNGSCSGSNQAAFTFTLKETPIITNTTLTQSICTGSATAAVSLSSNMGSGTTYSWTVTATTGTSGFVTPGTGNVIPATTLTNTTNSVGTVTYSVTPTNNGCAGTPDSFVVTVNPTPLIPNQTLATCSGTAFTVALTNNPPSIILPAGTTFTWTVTNPTGITGASNQIAPGIGSISQTLTNTTNAPVNVVYNVTASSGTAPSNCLSNFTVTVTVNPKPFIPNQTVSTCSGVAFSVPLTNSPPSVILPLGTTFTWTVFNPAGITGASNQNASGVSSINQILSNSTNAPIDVNYNVIASSSTTPNACTSNFIVTVTVNPLPTITGNLSICIGSTTLLSGSATAATNNPWVSSNTAVATIDSTGLVTSLSVGTTTITYTNSNGCQKNLTVTINALPTITGILSVCVGSTTSLTGSLTVSTTTPWVSSNTPIATVTTTGVVTGVSVGSTIITYTNSNGCQKTVTVTVNPKPVISNQTAIICSGSSFTVAPSNLSPNIIPTGTTYSWSAPVVTGGLTGGASATAQTSITGTLTNPTNTIQTATYTVTPTSGYTGNCAGATFTITVTVNPKPVIANQTVTACSGNDFTVSLTNAAPSLIVPFGTTYIWAAPVSNPIDAITGGSEQTTGINSINQTLTNTTNASATLTYTVTPTSGAAGNCAGNPFTVIVTVNPKPTLLALTNQNFCNGVLTTAIPFNSTVSGTTFTWINSSPSIGLPANGIGAIPAFTASNSGSNPVTATLTVTPTASSCAGLAQTFTITVNPSPVVTFSSPNQLICSGDTSALVTLNSNSAGVSYQWTASIPSGISGATASGTNTIPAQTLVNNTNANLIVTYTATATLSGGVPCAGAQFVYTITVKPKPVIATNLADVICSGTLISVTPVNGNGNEIPAGTTYTWGVPVISPAGALTGAAAQNNPQTAIGQLLTNTSNATATATYTVIPHSNGCSGLPFDNVVTVNPKPDVTTSSNVVLCTGEASTQIGFTGNILGTTYTWSSNTTSIGITASGTNTIPSFTAINTGSTPIIAAITVTPSANGCIGIAKTFTITVNPTPTLNPIANLVKCNNTASGSIAFTGNVSGTAYAWTNDTPSIGLAVSGNGNIPTFNAINSGNTPVIATITVTPTANGCVGAVQTFTITVNPTPLLNQPANQEVCNGSDTLTISFTGSIAAATYSWVNSNTSIGLGASGTGDIAIFTAINTSGTPITASITVTPIANGCNGILKTFTITVNPSPTVIFTPANQTICSGSATALVNLSSSTPTGTTFSWTAIAPAGISGVITSGSNQIPVQTLINATNSPIDVIYSATVQSSGASVSCQGNIYTYTITVNPLPVITTQQVATICSGTAFSITPQEVTGNTIPSNTLYTWTTPVINPAGAITGGSAQSTPMASIGQTLTNLTDQTATATYTVTPKSGTCIGATFTIVVTVNPSPKVQFSGANQILCSGSDSSAILLSSLTTGNVTFGWTANVPNGISGATTSGTGEIPVQNLVNTTTNPLTVVYTAVATLENNGVICQGQPFNYSITINPSVITSYILSNYNGFNVSAAGGNDGSINMSVSGGSGTYTYLWTGPNGFNATTQDIANLFAGSYTITINDGVCEPVVVIIVVTEPLPFEILEAIDAHINVVCHGYATGAIKIDVTSESVGPYDYVLTAQGGGIIGNVMNQTATSHTFTGLTAGTYDVTVTDANGSIKTILGIIITEPTGITTAISATTNVLCFGGNNGSATVTASGGSGTLTYSWNTLPEQTLPTATGLTAGTYVVTITDSNNCSTTQQIIISEPDAITTTINAQTNVACFGESTGSATVVPTGGVAPYTYLWNTAGAATTPTVSGLAAGIYLVSVTDANNCTQTQTVTILQPVAALSASITATANISCFGGNNGSATVTASDATAPYTYSWNTTPVQTLATANGLLAGTYNVTITDANGCLTSSSVTLTEPEGITAVILDQTNVFCSGSSTGSATVGTTGGTMPYSYSWNTTPIQTSATAINLALGTYIVTVTDDNGCSTTQQVIITEPNGIVTSIDSQINVGCFGENTGSATITATGGTGSLSYAWDTVPVQNTLTATGLTAGIYNLTVTDDNGCTKVETITITQPAAVLSALIASSVNVSCFGGNNGSATLSASGGTAPYTYVWDTTPAQTTTSITGLIAGIYHATVTDTNNCITQATVTITQPDELQTAINLITNITCYGTATGAISISVTQASVADYTFTITGTDYLGMAYTASQTQADMTYTFTNLLAGVYAINITDANGCFKAILNIIVEQPASGLAITSSVVSDFNGFSSSCFGANNASIAIQFAGGYAPYDVEWSGPNGFMAITQTISNLAPGIYTLSITDAGGCPITNSYTITEPDDLVITIDLEKDITCFGDADGAIALTISGGTSTYTYSWTKNGVPFATTQDLSSLSPGVYVVSVSDSNSCGPKTATFTITEPPVLSLNLASQTNVLCFGEATGAIDVTVDGGTPGVSGYTFAWIGPNGFSSSSQNLTAILSGTYNLTVTDDSGCFKNLSVTISQPAEVLIAVTTTEITCYGANNASISLLISGGVAPYQILWSNLGGGTFQDNLSAGDYTITVTDANGCPKTIVVNIPEAPIFTINPVAVNISCFGAQNGSINLNIIGGIAPVSLVWNDSAVAGNIRNNLGPGTYTVTITDGKPCQITRTFIILEPQALILTGNTTNAFDCNDANSGAINLLVAGGTPPFQYAWSNGVTTEDLNGIPAGNYAVTVTDARGCSKSAQFSITRPAPIVIGVVTETISNCETKVVRQKFVAQVSGGVPPFIYNWSSGTVSGTNNNTMHTTQNGMVVLTVTDALGCNANYTFNVNMPALGNASYTSGSIAYSTYGSYSIIDPIQFTNSATGDYISISWNFGDGIFSNEENPIHSYVSEGAYVVTQTVTYAFGCVSTYVITLIVDKGYDLIMPNGFTPNQDGINDSFGPVFLGLNPVSLHVYDTWGELIYSEQGETIQGWNGQVKGQDAENGNYFYKVSAKTFYGTTINKEGPFVLIK